MIEQDVTIGDSFRAKAVVVSSGEKRHIMFIIAESDDELLVVPMDSFPQDANNLQYILYSKDFELNVNDYDYRFIKHKSFINYHETKLIPRRELKVCIYNEDVDVLDPISDEFLWDLIDGAKKSKFVKKIYKQFLDEHPWE